jgi:hypothetical protein
MLDSGAVPPDDGARSPDHVELAEDLLEQSPVGLRVVAAAGAFERLREQAGARVVVERDEDDRCAAIAKLVQEPEAVVTG